MGKAKENRQLEVRICTSIENVNVLYLLHSTLGQRTEVAVFAAKREGFKKKIKSESTSEQNSSSKRTGEALQTTTIHSKLLILYNEYKSK